MKILYNWFRRRKFAKPFRCYLKAVDAVRELESSCPNDECRYHELRDLAGFVQKIAYSYSPANKIHVSK